MQGLISKSDNLESDALTNREPVQVHWDGSRMFKSR